MNNETEHIFLINQSIGQPGAATQKTLQTPAPSQVNLENVEDFSTVCRTCATITECLIPIFSGAGLQNNLADKIRKHLPIQVLEQDELPVSVCYQCAHTLLAWHELVACCQQADEALKTRLRQIKRKKQRTAVSMEEVLRKGQELETFSKLGDRAKEKKESKPSDALDVIIKGLLVDHFNCDEDEDTLSFVCLKCTQTSMENIDNLVEHIKDIHLSEIQSTDELERLIKEIITYEERLIYQDSERDSDEALEDNKKVKQQITNNFQCPFCDFTFSSCSRLIHHLNQHLELNIDDGIPCCDTLFENKKCFMAHLQESHVCKNNEVEATLCKSCGFTSQTNEELQRHIATEHRNIKKKNRAKMNSKNQKYIPVPCPVCKETFANKYVMNFHLKSHTEMSKYFCDKCSRSYSNRGNLIAHQNLFHKGVLKHICEQCGEAFPTRSAKENHALLHTGENPHQCIYCSKSFRSKLTLTRHVEIHLDIRKYQCQLCPKKFRRSTHLKYHLKTHKTKK